MTTKKSTRQGECSRIGLGQQNQVKPATRAAAFGLIDFPEATCAEMLSHADDQRKDRVLTAQRSLSVSLTAAKECAGLFLSSFSGPRATPRN